MENTKNENLQELFITSVKNLKLTTEQAETLRIILQIAYGFGRIEELEAINAKK